MENIRNINPMTQNTQSMTQNNLFHGTYCDGRKSEQRNVAQQCANPFSMELDANKWAKTVSSLTF